MKTRRLKAIAYTVLFMIFVLAIVIVVYGVKVGEKKEIPRNAIKVQSNGQKYSLSLQKGGWPSNNQAKIF